MAKRKTQVKVRGHLPLMGFPIGQQRTHSTSWDPLGKKLSRGLCLYSHYTDKHTHAHIGSLLEWHRRPRSQLLSPASGGIASIWPVTFARATVAFLICQRAGAILWLSWLICSRRLEGTHTHTRFFHLTDIGFGSQGSFYSLHLGGETRATGKRWTERDVNSIGFNLSGSCIHNVHILSTQAGWWWVYTLTTIAKSFLLLTWRTTNNTQR